MKITKRVLSILLALTMAITMILPVFAENYATSGTCGANVTWEFDVPTRTLTISGSGDMYSGTPWDAYSGIIKSVVIEGGITSIGSYSFRDHSALASVSIPDSVTEIGSNVFENCAALNDIVIPDSVTSIDYWCFDSCSSLKSITIGNGISSIGYDAFADCSSLENVYISDLSSWCKITFMNDNYSKVSNPLCYAENLYLNGELVTDLVIPDDVTSIKSSAFYGCDSITSVTFNNNLTSIGYEAFSKCSNLSKVTINKKIVSIDETSFRYCNSLSEINVDENNETFKSIEGVLFSGNMIALLLYPAQKSDETYTIPDDVLIIKDYAFYNNNYLKDIAIPNSVATIGEYAFNSYVDDLYYNGTEEMWNSVSVDSYNRFGRIHYNCTNPDGHYTLTKVVNPSTCAYEGYSEYTCPCGYTLTKDYTYLDHTPGEWNIGYNPTCTNSGYKYQRCTVCGAYLSEEEIPATGHTPGEWQTVAPTCQNPGYEGICCTVCGNLLEGEVLSAIGSCSYEWVVIKEATVTQYGEKVLKCISCGKIIEVQKIDKLEPCANGHSWSNWHAEKDCTRESRYCKLCSEYEYRDLDGHKWSEWLVTKEPTCAENGNRWRSCTICGYNNVEIGTIPATGEHDYTWYTISVATCETDGVMLGECSVCDDIDVKATLKTGHSIVDGVCENCGYTEGFENDDNNNNTDNNENNNNDNDDVVDPSDDCSCNCHKSGISKFFFNFALFFQRIFGSNKTCDCGVAHY